MAKKPEINGALPAGMLMAGYAELLTEIKTQIQTSRVIASTAVNRQLMQLYWEIGKAIVIRQKADGWGKSVVERLSKDLRHEFPDITGLSPRNLWDMRGFFRKWSVDLSVLQQSVADLPNSKLRQAVAEISGVNLDRSDAEPVQELSQTVEDSTPKALHQPVGEIDEHADARLPEPLAVIPWGHNLQLLHKLKVPAQRLWYAMQTSQNGWSRAVLIHQIESDAYSRQGKAITSFKTTLPSPQSDLAQQIIKDPYNFDFLGLTHEINERELEKGLIDHLRTFLMELGKGFAFVGQQYQLEVGGRDYYIDLLFYHLQLGCYIVIDLKVEDFKPEFAGKMSFYLTAVDESLPNPTECPAIGLILCKQRNETIVEYTLRDATKPVGVATYSMAPPKLREELPTAEELQHVLGRVPRK